MASKVQEAIDLFGLDIVHQVEELVAVSDADGVYTMFEDMGMFEHAECVQYLYL